jgi:transposase
MDDDNRLPECRSDPVDMRELKALEIAARSKIAFADGVWLVPSQTSSGKYRVTLAPPSCTCDDFQLRQQPCKHVIAARLVCERDHGGNAPKIDTNEVPKRPTYKQDWPAYNRAQTTEKHRFQVLLADLCRSVPQPPRKPGRGRIPTLLSDAVFAVAFKVYSGMSCRRFSCDLQDAHERGYVSKPIHYNKVIYFTENELLTPILKGLIRQSSLPLRSVETTFAPDSSGFSVSRFVRWYDEKYGTTRSGRDWVKAHVICGTKTHIVPAVEILDRNAADAPQFGPLVAATAQNFDVKKVCADKGYLSEQNLEQVMALGGEAFIPFKSNSIGERNDPGSIWSKMYGYFQYRRDEFLEHYHARSNIESVFSMVKRKFGDSVRSRTDTAMVNEVLAKFLCHNIVVNIHSQEELGIEPVFWGSEPTTGDANILPLVRG